MLNSHVHHLSARYECRSLAGKARATWHSHSARGTRTLHVALALCTWHLHPCTAHPGTLAPRGAATKAKPPLVLHLNRHAALARVSSSRPRKKRTRSTGPVPTHIDDRCS